jgi:ribonuclease T2
MFRSRSWISRLLISFGLFAASALSGMGQVSAQDHRQNAPGEFDFYVLALSWSPSFCEAASERGNSGARRSSAAAAVFLRGPRPVAAI